MGSEGSDDGLTPTEPAALHPLSPRQLQTYLAATLMLCKRQRERPMLTTEAQIFVLERRASTQTWTESSSRAIPVHLYHDLSRRAFRIIAVEGSKPVLNGVLSSSVVMNKASSKFLQWVDTRKSLVYGLGFASERDLDAFTDTVARMNDLRVAKYEAADAAADPTAALPDQGPHDADTVLKHENARLKAALCQSSVNAAKWEAELGDLKELNSELRRELAAAASSSGSAVGEKAAATGQVDETLAEMHRLLCSVSPNTAQCSCSEDKLKLGVVLEEVKALVSGVESSRAWASGATSLTSALDAKMSEVRTLYESLRAHLAEPPPALAQGL